MNDDEIIETEAKELFEWLATYSHEIGGAELPTISPAYKIAIRTAFQKICDEARVDERIKTYDILNKRSVPSARMLYEMKMHTAKEIFNELEKKQNRIYDTVYFPEVNVLVISSESYQALKQKMGIE